MQTRWCCWAETDTAGSVTELKSVSCDSICTDRGAPHWRCVRKYVTLSCYPQMQAVLRSCQASFWHPVFDLITVTHHLCADGCHENQQGASVPAWEWKHFFLKPAGRWVWRQTFMLIMGPKLAFTADFSECEGFGIQTSHGAAFGGLFDTCFIFYNFSLENRIE